MERAPTCDTCPYNTLARKVLGKVGLAEVDQTCAGPASNVLVSGEVSVTTEGTFGVREVRLAGPVCAKDLPADYDEKVAAYEQAKNDADMEAQQIRDERGANGVIGDDFPPIFEI